MNNESSEFTKLLNQADQGDRSAADRLYRLVEKQLRAIAKSRKRRAPSDVEMSATALVNDAFLGVVGQEVTTWPSGSRQKFFAYISTAMHSVLIDTARAQSAKKRGGDYRRVPDPDGHFEFDSPNRDVHVNLLLDLKEALGRFEEFAEKDALVFRVRYLLGLTFDEIADIYQTSATSVKRSFERAKAWLQKELKDYRDDS